MTIASIRIPARLAAALIMSSLAASPCRSDSEPDRAGSLPPFQAHVDMQTFMEHVLTPAAQIVWSVNGSVIDANGEHNLSPKSDDDWEKIVSGAATLAEATNALMIPARVRDAEWNRYARKLADAAARAYHAAEEHDLKAVSDVSDALDEICASCHRHYGVE